MNIRRVDLRELVTPGPQAFALHDQREQEVTYAEDTGYHIYGELRLGLRVTAADELRSARQHLAILEQYALATEVAAAAEGAHVFEVQGERVHLFLPALQDDRATVNRVLRFSSAFNDLVYAEVAKTAGSSFLGFAQAACHGRTVILRHGTGPGMSVISLSPAANAPAKHLGKDEAGRVRVAAKHLAIPAESLRRAGYPTSSRGTWENVPLDPLPAALASTRDRAFLDGMTERLARDLVQRGNLAPIQFWELDEAFYATPIALASGQAAQVTGFFLRADLSGFTHEVSAAFAQGGASIVQLVERFTGILKHADQFSSKVAAPNLIRIPWAGDCANIGVLPRFGQSYEDGRESIPCDVPAEWHSHWRLTSGRAWLGALLAKAKWTVGCAGGDVEDEGDAPVMLVAVLRGGARSYLVAAGWSVGRSSDALECDGLAGGNTAIPKEDWSALESHRQALFKELDSRFRVSVRPPDYEEIRQALIRSAREPKQIIVGASGLVIPGARHFGHGH